ncbi:hypothetical protein GF376_02135 [Candidatus Peregrinibacteria bacterium]|nr:hypothetical protein [Candidatus Peregrinibacteria bacterium]
MKNNRPKRNSEFVSLLEVAASKYGVRREFRAIKICNDAKKALQELDITFETKLSYKDQCLKVSVSNSAQAQKIQMISHQLAEKIDVPDIKIGYC